MKFLKLPKFKIPNWLSSIKSPKIFHRSDSQRSFYSTWKKFLGQIPRESRATMHSYQHFIVLGNAKSGKTDLIRGLTEQSQDLYPFDTSYTLDPDIQFYLGPNQVIQEISFAALEDKSIRGRRKTIKLWKKLYARRDPIIVVVFDALSNRDGNLKEINRLAQLLAGKVSLLSEIIKKSVKVRIALTHLDQIPGYVEFARFLKQENLTFEINLPSDFQSHTLEASLKKFFEDHLNLMLTTSSNMDFFKMLAFSKEMPSHFLSIEEFLRVLVSRVSFANSIDLDTLSFTSNQESSTSFNPFQWTRLHSMEIFFRHPLLKHQIAAAAICFVLITPLIYFFYNEKMELNLAKKGIEQLNLLQYQRFEDKLVPSYVRTFEDRNNEFLAFIKPDFFGAKLQDVTNRLANKMRRHYIEKEYRKALLENKGELKSLYFNGLLHATCTNNMGKFILQDSKKIAEILNLDENILKAYILSCHTINASDNSLFDFEKSNPFVPFTSFNPWVNFFKTIKELSDQQIYGEQNFEDITSQSLKLKLAVNELLHNPLTHNMATMLEEEKGLENINENIKVVRWIGDNSQSLISFFQFIQETSMMPVEIENMNIAQFFTKIKQMSEIRNKEVQTYKFDFDHWNFSLATNLWVDLVIAHNVERAIENYATSNNKSEGDVFFKNTSKPPEPTLPICNSMFPYFFEKMSIPGSFTRMEYANKVRSTAEKLAHCVDKLNVNPEAKKRFTTFLAHEVMGYVQKYGSHYDEFFEQCDIQNGSLLNLKAILHDLSQDASSFHELLKFMNFHTSAFSEPITVLGLKNMKELNQFDFLNKILTVHKDEIPYENYQKLMGALAEELNRDPSAIDSQYRELSAYFTSLARISSDILQDNPQSYKKRVRDCLREMGVPDKYQTVFLKPMNQLYKLGLPDLKRCVEQIWAANFDEEIDLLLGKFPFNPNGTEILTIEEVEAKFNPNSPFYKAIKEVMSTCCKNNAGVWVPLDGENLELESKIFTKLNQIQKISDLFWDKTGTPQPINLTLQPVPFTNDPTANPIIVLTYFVLGDQNIRNLNQNPTLQPLKVEWWKSENCLVGVELMSKYTNSKTYKSNPKLATAWSFFQMVREAERENGNIFTWIIKDDSNGFKYVVSFAFDKDPRYLLVENKTQE